MSHGCIFDELGLEDFSELVSRRRTVIHRPSTDHSLKHIVVLVTSFKSRQPLWKPILFNDFLKHWFFSFLDKFLGIGPRDEASMQLNSVSISACILQQGPIRNNIVPLSSNLIVRISELLQWDLLCLVLIQKSLHIKWEVLHNDMYEFGVCGCDHFLKLFLLLLDDALFSVGFAHDDELFRGEICNCTMLRDPLAVHWLFGLEKLLNDWHELLVIINVAKIK